ncbi:LANO_0E10924g1_1 [Lachancea nothofagi CBS 11611]|uniref:LANO_0E10924g1_1 n=1 Tax=Lachancea nothofagi CBS 11611 TaxID=1266666 RepID=A0A1G4JX15_9SACH|nr:LANO_0E10924g1_1 [Lachancea nothofagi CBS 11611]
MFKYSIGLSSWPRFNVAALRNVRFLASEARVTVKPLHSRKTFLIDSYKDMMDKNPVVLFAHHNNLLKQENAFFRSQIQQLGGKMTVVRNQLFQVYLRNSHLEDPCAPSEKLEQNRQHPLMPLFKGPTAAITFSETEPDKIAKLLKLLDKSSDKMFVVGAKIEGQVLDVPSIHDFKTLPSKNALQGQLLGLLTVLSGAGLVRTLEAGSHSLYLTLQSHHDNIDPENKKSE